MSVEFKLFGELTIKQFLYVGGGAGMAYLVVASDMNVLVKLILSVILAGGGAALALIPINNQPLEVWIGNFLVAMFNPTKRVWKKGENPNNPKTIYTTADEFSKMNAINASTMPDINTKITYTPKTTAGAPISSQNSTTTLPNSAKIEVQQSDLISTEEALATVSPLQATTQTTPKVEPAVPSTAPQNLITKQNNMTMENMDNSDKTKDLQQVISNPAPGAKPVRQTFILDINKLQDHAAALPGYAPKPNILKGVVKAVDGGLIAGAIVIIKRKENNQPARAMVTNALGEFETSTSLDDGTYLIDISHSDREMPLYELSLNSTPVPPMQFQFTA